MKEIIFNLNDPCLVLVFFSLCVFIGMFLTIWLTVNNMLWRIFYIFECVFLQWAIVFGYWQKGQVCGGLFLAPQL